MSNSRQSPHKTATSRTPQSIGYDVTRENFIEQSNDFIKRLPDAAWISLDEEMTGIMIPGTPRPNKEESPALRYATLKQAPERYSIIQLGVCLFEPIDKKDMENTGAFHVHRYKFTLFPGEGSDREIVMNPSSMQFLRSNNLQLDEWVEEGLSFCTREAASTLAMDWYGAEQEKKDAPPDEKPTSSHTVQLRRAEDKDFHARAMASLREWLDMPVTPGENDPEGVSFYLPMCNSFLRRALYETIPREYPNLVLETEDARIRVWRLNPEEKERREKRLLREGWEELLTRKIGIYRVFLALSLACKGQLKNISKSLEEHIILAPDVDTALGSPPFSLEEDSAEAIPLIVHNGLQDLLFLLTHFERSNLPEDWGEAKALIHSTFPIVYDTKTMACDYAPRGWVDRGRTYLKTLYDATLARQPYWKREFTAQGTDTISNEEQCHDAAYDAFMTGVSFYGLSTAIQEDRMGGRPVGPLTTLQGDSTKMEVKHLFGRNSLCFYFSPYTIDLETPGSKESLGGGMSVEATFRVADIDSAVSTRDIVRCLSGLSDSAGQRVNFEIIWVDDTTFIVAATLPDWSQALASGMDLSSRFAENGSIVYNALRSRFTDEKVRPLEGYSSETLATGSSSVSFIRGLWNYLSGAKRSADTSDSSDSNKRRRIS